MLLFSYTSFAFVALLGFCIALYIYRKKSNSMPMVCPMKGNCSAVIHSEFGSFFGIGVEVIGMAYYAVIACCYGALALYPHLATPLAQFVLLALSTVAFLFSLYLVFIQTFALRQFCTWCIASALLCAFIFFATIAHPAADYIAVLAFHKRLLLSLHLTGLALGLGGALITDIFFFKFLKDYKISESEADTMSTLSQVIWVGLAVLIMSGVGLYLPETTRLNASPKFLVKMIVICVIVINGLFLNLLIAPKLVKITFARKERPGDLRYIRKIAFALGAISMISWTSAFILGSFRSSPLPFLPLLGIYIGMLIVGITGSQVTERKIVRSAPEQQNS